MALKLPQESMAEFKTRAQNMRVQWAAVRLGSQESAAAALGLDLTEFLVIIGGSGRAKLDELQLDALACYSGVNLEWLRDGTGHHGLNLRQPKGAGKPYLIPDHVQAQRIELSGSGSASIVIPPGGSVQIELPH